MLVLGVDPGIAITGFGLVAEHAGELSAVDYGIISTSADLTLSERLAMIYDELRALLTRHRPDVMAVEVLFFARNVRTAMAVSHARGVVLLAAAHAGIRVFEYTPLQVKEALAGYGRATKPQMQDMIRLLLHLRSLPHPDDAADALAVAVCHAHSHRLSALVRS